MKACKDCIHYEACKAVLDAAGLFSDEIEETLNAIKCPNFADKSRFIELDEDFESILICAEHRGRIHQAAHPEAIRQNACCDIQRHQRCGGAQ